MAQVHIIIEKKKHETKSKMPSKVILNFEKSKVKCLILLCKTNVKTNKPIYARLFF
jgi:hypothetical protein